MDCGTPGFPVHHHLPEWIYSNSCPLSRWRHPTISSSVVPFSSHLQSFPASGSFPLNQLFASGGQSIAVSASISVIPMNIQDWYPLGWTAWISLQSKGLSRVFSSTTIQKHLFFSTQPSLWSNYHTHTWLLENNSFDHIKLCQQSDIFSFWYSHIIWLSEVADISPRNLDSSLWFIQPGISHDVLCM